LSGVIQEHFLTALAVVIAPAEHQNELSMIRHALAALDPSAFDRQTVCRLA
jgi:hypothetical protein